METPDAHENSKDETPYDIDCDRPPGMTSKVDCSRQPVPGQRTYGASEGNPNSSGHSRATLDKKRVVYSKDEGLVTISYS